MKNTALAPRNTHDDPCGAHSMAVGRILVSGCELRGRRRPKYLTTQNPHRIRGFVEMEAFFLACTTETAHSSVGDDTLTREGYKTYYLHQQTVFVCSAYVEEAIISRSKILPCEAKQKKSAMRHALS